MARALLHVATEVHMGSRSWNGSTKAVLLGAGLAARALVRTATRVDLRGKVVAIFGGSRGLGLDLARQLSAKGALVAIGARDAGELERALDDVAGEGASSALAATCDATVDADAQRFLTDVRDRLGDVDIVITCAATIQVGPEEAMTKSDYEECLSQIFWSTYVPTMAALPAMRARKRGHLVHVTSFGGEVPAPHLLPYSVAKFAATGFSKGLRSEVAKDGITVTTVTPGIMRTGAHLRAQFKGDHAREMGWFGLGATLPGLSTSSERAARRIVSAIEHGEAEPMMSPLLRLATIASAAAPGLFAKLLIAQNALLPKAKNDGSTTARTGADVLAQGGSTTLDVIDRIGAANAEKHNEVPERAYPDAAIAERRGS